MLSQSIRTAIACMALDTYNDAGACTPDYIEMLVHVHGYDAGDDRAYDAAMAHLERCYAVLASRH